MEENERLNQIEVLYFIIELTHKLEDRKLHGEYFGH